MKFTNEKLHMCKSMYYFHYNKLNHISSSVTMAFKYVLINSITLQYTLVKYLKFLYQ